MPTIFLVLLLPVLISLGFWQLDRAKQKEQLLRKYQAALSLQPIKLPRASEQWMKLHYHPVTFQGFYDNDHTLFLDNKLYQHRVGYHVLTPVVLENKRRILVDRGWIPLQNRAVLPQLPRIIHKQTITGFIEIPNPKPFLLSHRMESDGWPRRIQAIEMSRIKIDNQQIDYPVIVLLAPSAKFGFVRDWQPVATNMPPARHIAYAVQWFSLALTLTVIFLVVNLKRQ